MEASLASVREFGFCFVAHFFRNASGPSLGPWKLNEHIASVAKFEAWFPRRPQLHV